MKNARSSEMNEGKPVGIWIRVSTEDQTQRDSPKDQERRARTHAETKGWRLRDVYRLEGVSGGPLVDRAEKARVLGPALTSCLWE